MSKETTNLEILRHSAAHLLAHAVKELYPDTLIIIGPATPEGFFFDFLPKTNFKDEDLPKIKTRMDQLVAQDLPLTHEEISKDEARKLYTNNPFKLELIDGIEGNTVGLARQGDYYDLCRGGHVDSTGQLKWVKLLNISGSYWRANRDGQPLQRISGTAFFTKEDLEKYEQRQAEALKYDHRRLGKELELFSFHEEGPGFPFYHPRGQRIINQLKQHLRTYLDRYGYDEISTPIMMNVDLWKQSGHYDHYRQNMYFSEIDDVHYAIRPMNCPGSILVYKNRPHSYRELPLRFAEFGLVHRYELSGVLHGLFRARAFTQDDGHIYCTQEQIQDEVLSTIHLIYDVFKAFEFNKIIVKLATKPESYIGSDELWDHAIQSLQTALKNAQVEYEICPGDGAFYGPKIDFHIEDSMERIWQCSTIQLDFFQPENFGLSYVTKEGIKAQPVMIHRAIYGSLERFFGIILEHFKGNLPFWLAPIQAKILTITDEQKDYAQELLHTLHNANFRVTKDDSSDPLSGQIKTAQLERIPWMLIIGKKEVANNTITIRHRNGKQEFGLNLEELMTKARELNKV